ncbi:NTP transferase domain-containing protein [Helicobacter pullorum]|uniref:NTP transferase domain-containing protein n=1 Tax=Helicobacter pullorum TaxID=35818 RepID=UPI000816A4DF|nr:NTP transferase domain-containing protein [Helicobacter pullorum]OCR07503.1 hypothetical protein A7X13_08595 [Helicobacter pullorum]
MSKDNVCVVIPAQDSNRYHKDGDLAPFGNTTLLEWKIAQCKEFVPKHRIYISSQSQKIRDIALREGVEFVLRDSTKSYVQNIRDLVNSLPYEYIVYVHCTTPFMNACIYDAMYQRFISQKMKALISVRALQEFIFYKGERLNVDNAFTLRTQTEPVYIVSNGCYVFQKDQVKESENFIFADSELFALEKLASIEIKDIEDYTIARELITMYFTKEVMQ